MYSNSRGIRSKVHSLNAALDNEKPDILILVETQLAGKYNIKIDGYDKQIKRNRSTKGGGLLVATRNSSDLEMLLVSCDETQEQMCIQVSNRIWKFRLIVAYGLQESRSSEEDLDDWYYKFEKITAQNEEEAVIIIGD